MSKVIPKEKLTAYQRWELATFDEHAPVLHQAPMPESPEEPPPHFTEETMPTSLGITLPTAEELEHIQQEAWREGFTLGQEEGRKQGLETGKTESAQLMTQLRALISELDAESIRQDENLAQEILALALAVSKQLVSTALRTKPELILPCIREAVASLPSLNGHHRIFVHPDHAHVINDWLTQEHPHLSWKVVEDTKQAQGGFRIESNHSELDATLQTRWREIVKSFGVQDNDWLE